VGNLSDQFTRADSAVALGGGFTANVGTWGISSNQAYTPVANSTIDGAIATIDTGESDGYAEVTCTAMNEPGRLVQGAVAFRYVDANNYWDAGIWQGASLDYNVYIGRVVAGSVTAIFSVFLENNKVTPFKIGVEFRSSTIRLFIDGVQQQADQTGLTDHMTATKHGLNIYDSTAVRLDDFRFEGGRLVRPTPRQTARVRASRW
jgi:hypothetical protein